MKFIKPFRGVPNGRIYPVQFEVGDECPPELETAARAENVLETEKKATNGTRNARNSA